MVMVVPPCTSVAPGFIVSGDSSITAIVFLYFGFIFLKEAKLVHPNRHWRESNLKH